MDDHRRECSRERSVCMKNGFPWKSLVTPVKLHLGGLEKLIPEAGIRQIFAGIWHYSRLVIPGKEG